MAKLVNQGAGPYFPIAAPLSASYSTGMRRFASGRSKRKNKATGKLRYYRAHAGCDLYCPAGTPIFSVADGELLIR
jgi:murein DD-endopeptidase MepM/ murein hydrolase activator NlpD